MTKSTLNSICTKRLNELRTRNIKQEAMAKYIGISQQAYSKLESGQANFTNELISKIADFFEISVEDFLGIQSSVSIVNSPQSNNNHSPTSIVNEGKIMLELIKAKDQIIQLLQKKK